MADRVPPSPRQGSLTADELAQRLGTEPERVVRLVEAGAILRSVDGTFEPGDVHRVRLLIAFESSGVPMDALVAAYRSGRLTFDFYDELHPAPGPVADRPYAAFAAALGDAASLLPGLFAAFGLAEPDPVTRLTLEEEALLARLAKAVAGTGRPDLALRAIRTSGEGARRAAAAAMGAYEDAVAGHDEAVTDLPLDAYLDRYLRPWARFAQLVGPTSGWLAARHLTRAIDDYSVRETEGVLEASSFVPARDAIPPAIGFVDLTGFTRLTVERGDEAAAALAMRLGDVTAETVGPRGGHVVKLLGDGVLVRFDDAVAAIDGTLALLAAIGAEGLPGGHAGVASGPVVQRDGDVFGRTVNLAARLADAATDGVLLVPSTLAVTLPDALFATTPAGTAHLHGVGDLEVSTVRRAEPSRAEGAS